MKWQNVNLTRWAKDWGVSLEEIDQKLKLREMIIKVRNKKGLSQAEVALKVGISRSRFAQIESGIKIHKMSFDILLRTLTALGYRYQIITKLAA